MTGNLKRCGLSLVVIAASAAPAAAKPSISVSGTLDHSGYAVVALGYNGSVAISHSRSFKLRVAAKGLTLQLLTRGGRYGGPVVVGYSGKWALEGITGSVKLGKIRVLRGYARPARLLARRFVDRRRLAYAKQGIPIGNGRNFGFVASRGRAAAGPGLDQDQDGVPDIFDVARSGRKVLNALASASAGRYAARAADAPGFDWMSQIFLTLDQTLNADASGVTTAEIDRMLVSDLNLKGLNIPSGDLVELDCGGLTYCSPGGTGQVVTGFAADGAFLTTPLSQFVDQSGFVALRGSDPSPLTSGPYSEEFSLMPHAASDQIQTGDTPILRITSGGALTQTPEPIDFVFNTVPALAAYSDSAGESGSITYPAAINSPGTLANPIQISPGADGHVVLTMRVFRPQRAGISGAGEPAFMDIGHLRYSVDLLAGGPAPTNTPPQCPIDSLSTDDPSLTLSDAGAGGAFTDSANDHAADPANSLTMTVDLTRCLSDKGITSIGPGQMMNVEIEADAQAAHDHANQRIFFIQHG